MGSTGSTGSVLAVTDAVGVDGAVEPPGQIEKKLLLGRALMLCRSSQ